MTYVCRQKLKKHNNITIQPLTLIATIALLLFLSPVHTAVLMLPMLPSE